MKKLFIVVLAAIGMVSCMNTDEVIEVSNGDAIAFADAFIENSVRATAYDNGSLDHFNVWGTVTAGQSTAPIFANTEVEKDTNGVWSYTGATQYWVKGVTYNFRALVDGTTPVVVDDMLTGVNVNITEQEDVLVAEDMNVTYTGGEKYVAFQFAHILSKVKFTFDTTIANTAYTYTISNVKIADKAEAAYDIASKAWSGHNGAATIEFTNLTDEMFLIPSAEEKTISFDVTLKLGDVVLSQETKSIVTDVELLAGNAYNFTVVLGEPGEPIKFTATVKDWAEVNYDVDNATYLVGTAEEFMDLIENILDNEDATIVLTDDIDLNAGRSVASNWTPIGTEEKPFTGTFDGNGKTIKNLTLVEPEAKEGKAFIGFFGYAKNATIKNVTFENVYINIPCLDIDHSQGHIGAVAGSLEGKSTIENVTVKGDIKVYATQDANGASRVAVVAGGNSYGDVTMENVHVVANEGSYLIANNNTGALAGQLQGKSVFKNCSSNIDVTVNKFFAGGLIGLAAGDQLFENCHTTGDVAVVAGREGRAHDQYRVGGIAGGWADGANKVCTLIDCSYTGEISGKNSDGSVVEKFDYLGYVGRGYTLNGCAGSKVVIDGVEFVQISNSAAEAGVYEVIKTVANAQELQDAIDNGVTTIVLSDNVTIDENTRDWNSGSWYDGIYYVGDKNLTLDLNGKTLTHDGSVNDYLINLKNDGSKPNTVTIKNGVVDAGTAAFCALCTSSTSNQQITINLENVELINNNINGSTIKVRGGAELNVKAGTKITGKNSYLGIEVVASTCNIYDGAEIYQKGASSYLGGLVGVCGNGVANVYGGKGVSARCGLIAMTSGGVINVAGGEWTANTDGTIGNNSNLYVLTAQNNKYESGYCGASIINVTGGTFRGGMDAWILNDVNVEKAELNISGGNFNADPKHYVEDGYLAIENNGIYNVVQPTKVASAAELTAAVAKGGFITLTADIEVTEPIAVENGNVTLDLNGKTITATLVSAIVAKNGAEVTIKGDGKVIAYGSVVSAQGGKVIVENGTFTSTGTALDSPATYRYSIDSREDGEIIINGGEFKSNNGLMNVGSEIVINGGKFENVVEKTMTRHFAYVSAPLTINGGEFLGKANSSAGGCFFCGAASGCDIQINGGKFTSLWVSGSVNRIFEVYYGGTINVTGGMFNTNGGIATFVEANTDDATKDAYPYVAK